MLKRVLSFLTVLFLSLFSLGAIKSITTEHFEILFYDSSSETAKAIAQICDEEYEKLTEFFGRNPELHIPVYITEKVKQFNAYFSSYPSNHIVFYDAAVTSENIFNYKETIRSVFGHELTHAFNYNLRSGVWKALARIFGDPVTSGPFLYEDSFFIEGLAVYYESSGGSGRLNDPFFYQKLKQMKADGVFPSWTQVHGNSDLYPSGNRAYMYGSFFLQYLSKAYGEEKLLDYYNRADHISTFSFNPINSLFEKVYGVDSGTVWSNFQNSINVPESFEEGITVNAEKQIYNDLTYRDGYWYALSSTNGKLTRYNGDFSEKEVLLTAPNNSGNFDISRSGAIAIPITTENKARVMLKGTDIRTDMECRYVCFVYPDGEEKLFTAWSEGLSMNLSTAGDDRIIRLGSAPVYDLCALDDSCVAVLYNRDGRDTLATVDVVSMEMTDYVLPETYRFRFLSCTGGELYMTCVPAEMDAPTFAMCAKAVIRDGKCEVYVSQNILDGGVYMPVKDNSDTFLYEARHADGNILCTAEICDFNYIATVIPETSEEQRVRELSFSIKEKSRLSTLMRGLIVPIAYDQKTNLAGAGLTWITTDPTETFGISASAGYSLGKNNWPFAKLTLADTKTIPVTLSVSSVMLTPSANVFLHTNLALEYSHELGHSGQLIKIKDSVSLSSLASWSSFTNNASIAYYNQKRTGLGPFDIVGYAIGLSLANLKPGMNFVFKLRYPLPTTVTLKLTFNSHHESLNVKLASWEAQDKIPVLPVFVRRMTLEADLDYDGGTLLVVPGVYLYCVPQIGGIGDYLNSAFKVGAQYIWNVTAKTGSVKILFSSNLK